MNSTVLRWIAPLAFLAVMFGGVGVAQATGHGVTTGRQEITAGQQLTPDDLRGWMTLQEAADGLAMPVADLIGLIGAPDGVALTGDTAFKDLEDLVPDFELTAFREVVRANLAAPAPAAPVPAPTAPALAPTAPTPATTAPAAPATTAPAPAPTGTGASSGITGSMSLREVARANGLDPAALAAKAGLPPDVPLDTPLRDLRETVPGLEVGDIRDAVAALG